MTSYPAKNIRNLFNTRNSWYIAVIILFAISNLTSRSIADGIQNIFSSDWRFSLANVSFLKGVLFYPAIFIICLPLFKDIKNHLTPFPWKVLVERLAWGLILFFSLAILVFPYNWPQQPGSDPSGLVSIGRMYGDMSQAPFSEQHEFIFRRIFAPAMAYLFQFKGKFLYYYFSLVGTFVLITLASAVLDKVLSLKKARWPKRWVILLSFLSVSCILCSFQWPGYPEQWGLVFILIAFLVPLGLYSKMTIIALSLLIHDGLIFALLGPILFFLKKDEKTCAIFIVLAFYLFCILGYGGDVKTLLVGHEVIDTKGGSTSIKELFHPLFMLKGIFFSYKYIWVIFIWGLISGWKKAPKISMAMLASVVLALGINLLANDTTRLSSLSFIGVFGIVLPFSAFILKEGKTGQRFLLYLLLAITLLTPNYNFHLLKQERCLVYNYQGLYKFIDKVLVQGGLSATQ
jgi:hypothetical protein